MAGITFSDSDSTPVPKFLNPVSSKISDFTPCAYAHRLIFCISNTLRKVILRLRAWCLGKCVRLGFGVTKGKIIEV